MSDDLGSSDFISSHFGSSQSGHEIPALEIEHGAGVCSAYAGCSTWLCSQKCQEGNLRMRQCQILVTIGRRS
eukprot:1850885-Karenia_brevis.AAC.1